MRITVPPVPNGLHPASCWRKTLTGLDARARGGNAVEGHFLQPGDVVDLPEGTVVVTVDKATTGWDTHYKTGERYALKNATVAAHLVTDDGLTLLWGREYQTLKSAFGAFTLKKLAAILAEHPAPAAIPVVVEEAQRPNGKAGVCRWCGLSVREAAGTVGHGEDREVEHWQKCPSSDAEAGTACAVCGVPVAPWSARRVMVREGEGRWEVRHRPELDCWENPQPSDSEYREQARAEQEAAAARRAEAMAAERAKEQRKLERAAAKRAAEEAAHRAEEERVAGLATVSRVSEDVYDKGLGDGQRACMRKHTDTLEDGTTTVRWSVETYYRASGAQWVGEDGDGEVDGADQFPEFTRREDAHAAYRELKFTPGRGRGEPGSGRTCDNCSRRGAIHRRHDSSGILGMVCGQCDREDDFQLSFA